MQQVQAQEQVKSRIVSQPRQSRKMILGQGQAFSFTVPALVLLAIFLIYPIGYVVYLGFQRWDLLGSPVYIGLQNYNTILFQDSSFLQSIGVTFLFVVLAVPTQVGLGLFLAVLLDSEFRGRMFFRTVFFIPMVISFVAAGIVFQWMFSTGANLGTFPQLLATIGFTSWPLLVPTTALLIITTTIGCFQAFEPFYVMTNGGPTGATTSIIFYIYNNFASRTGVATAAATLFLLGVLMITAVQLLVSRRREVYY